MYTIDRSSNSRRKAVEDAIWGLDLVSPDLSEKIVTAWVTTWAASSHERLEDMPWSPGADYPLINHVNEVTKAGVDLAKRARADWKMDLDDAVLIPALILHDVDKPMMYERKGREVVRSDLSREIPHGVVGGMLLKELGFSHEVISVVTTHSPAMPFHHRGNTAYVLHHADMFSADQILRSLGKPPTYQKPD
jgi:hypothetical protein